MVLHFLNTAYMPFVYNVPEIRSKRIALKVSQGKMADVIKVNVNTYKRYEKSNDMWFSQAQKCTEYLRALEEVEKKIND
jgi:DNA-binding XRE family transcriptional regulator